MGEGSMKRQRIKHLPEEVIAEILLSNLPIKSLLRFKCVSKSWRSLISSARFVKEHLNRSNSDPDLTYHNLIGIFYDNETGLSVSSCALKPSHVEPNQDDVVPTWDHSDRDAYYSKIIGSCNGLILIDDDEVCLSLWNPATEKLKAIPPPSIRELDCVSRPSYYSHGKTWHYCVSGFGYDDSTDDYKVVWIIYRLVDSCREVHQTKMYSVRTDSWKRIDNFEKGFRSSVDCQGKFANGKLHWLVWKEGVSTIVSLGLVEGEEKYQVVAMPSNYDPRGAILANLGGYLSLIDSLGDDTDIDVWVMMKYGVGESWNKIWTFSNFHDPRPIYDSSVQPFWVTKNGDIFVVFDKYKIVVYNAKKKLREYLINKDELEPPSANATCQDDDHFYECESRLRLRPPLFVYVESLVSP